ncbi:MAG: hypothetical protein ACR2FS_12695 [Phormidesmis sp.]
MSIEQTNQLILLILNSVLMTLLSAALLGGAWLRQNMLSQQLSQVQRRYQQMTHRPATGTAEAQPILEKAQLRANLKRMRHQRQRLSNQYLWSHLGMLTLHIALLIFGVSLFALALRSLLSFDGLISTALFLFTLGSAGLLAGAGCILIDLVQGNSGGDSLGQSLGKVIAQFARWWQRRKSAPLIEPVGESR